MGARVGVLLLAALPSVAQACDACMGGKDPNLRPAVNGAIFFMLGIVALMLSLIGFFIAHLARRARSPMAVAQMELVQMMTEGANHA